MAVFGIEKGREYETKIFCFWYEQVADFDLRKSLSGTFLRPGDTAARFHEWLKNPGMPLHTGQPGQASHWSLAVYDRTRNTVTIADSQQQEPGSPRYSRTLERVVQYLNQLGRGDAIPTLEILDVPQQKDGASCGLHTLSNLAALVRGGTHHSSDLFELGVPHGASRAPQENRREGQIPFVRGARRWRPN
ncbi:hypothetical protein G7054_g12783 [Neopestalotiopsis clavispora]|nr:hypothetical protein G7054_g12783 [Neopestalotiopsis clavispora]